MVISVYFISSSKQSRLLCEVTQLEQDALRAGARRELPAATRPRREQGQLPAQLPRPWGHTGKLLLPRSCVTYSHFPFPATREGGDLCPQVTNEETGPQEGAPPPDVETPPGPLVFQHVCGGPTMARHLPPTQDTSNTAGCFHHCLMKKKNPFNIKKGTRADSHTMRASFNLNG